MKNKNNCEHDTIKEKWLSLQKPGTIQTFNNRKQYIRHNDLPAEKMGVLIGSHSTLGGAVTLYFYVNILDGCGGSLYITCVILGDFIIL